MPGILAVVVALVFVRDADLATAIPVEPPEATPLTTAVAATASSDDARTSPPLPWSFVHVMFAIALFTLGNLIEDFVGKNHLFSTSRHTKITQNIIQHSCNSFAEFRRFPHRAVP
ncbi:MAG: hypothetical protein IT353_12580 [Gemmatimonadaceae bacterium]|nr:hypothetical protein [Gemmatimonadaceae bacterium]